MRNVRFFNYILLLILFSLSSCNFLFKIFFPNTASFTGEYIKTKEDYFSFTKTVEGKTVVTDGERFIIEDESKVLIYDGKNLFTKHKNKEQDSTSIKPMDRIGASAYKFWIFAPRGIELKQENSGESIAGRETFVLEKRENPNDPNSKLKYRFLIDKETMVVLKSESWVLGDSGFKVTEEFQKIEYGPIDKSIFKIQLN